MATFGTTQQVGTFNPGTTQEEDQAALNDFLNSGGINNSFGELSSGSDKIQNLSELGDPTKLVPPSDLSGLTTNLTGIGSKFKDMGAGTVIDASAAENTFGKLETVQTPITDSSYSSMGGMIDSAKSQMSPMVGTGTGSGGLPTVRDFIHPVAGGSVYDDIAANGLNATNLAELDSLLDNATDLRSKAGIDLSSPPPQTLGTTMNFGTSLHKWGADMSEGGIGNSLREMADTSTSEGEALAASLAEGRNNAVLSANGIGPIQTNPFAGLPSQEPSDPNQGAKLFGGSPSSEPVSTSSASGFSQQGGSFGSGQIQGQTGTGLEGLNQTLSGDYDTSGMAADQAKLDDFTSSGGLDNAFNQLNR